MSQTEALLQCVEGELQLVGRLLEVLAKERQVLQSNDAEQIAILSQVKSQVVGEFAVASQARYGLLQGMGFEPRDQGMQLFLIQNSPTELAQLWADFISKVGQAKEENKLNGVLLQQLSLRNQSALEVLQGRKGAALYGPTGQKNNQAGFRSTVS